MENNTNEEAGNINTFSRTECPICGSNHIHLLRKNAFIVAVRECRECGCRWAPKWPKSAGYTAIVLGTMLGPLMIYGFVMMTTGEYQVGDMPDPGSIWTKIKLCFWSLCIALYMVYTVTFGIGVIRGTKGLGKIVRVSRDSTVEEDPDMP